LKEFDTSFAKFCGLNKDQYENIYIKSNYIPKIDSFGNIKINIKNIIKVLNELPSEDKMNNKKLIKFKKILKGNKKTKKLKFRIFKKINKKIKIKIPSILQTPVRTIVNSNNSGTNSSNLQKSGLGFNIKNKGKGLSINIPKNKDILFNNIPKLNIGNNKTLQNLIPNKTLTFPMGNVFNKNIISNIPNKPNINPLTINSVLSNSRQQANNDVFNFSSRDIRNYLNISNNYWNNASLSPNIPYTPIISPFPISPYPNIFSAHLNNGLILPDGNNYNNTLLNPNSFIFPNNSPALINININNTFNLNNNVSNGNILNNNIGSQNNSFKISNSNNNSINTSK
jgi:hypothetical protein